MLVFAQAMPEITPPPEPETARAPLTQPRQVSQIQQDVRPLPGQLDDTLVFNSNSPELIQSEGILLSTFPGNQMQHANAHLNFPIPPGRFDIFAHHIARGLTPDDDRTLYVGILVHNPDSVPVTINTEAVATYLGQDAPFHNLPSYVSNPLGTAYSGPGSRTMNAILRRNEFLTETQRQRRYGHLEAIRPIQPGETRLLLAVPIPLHRFSHYLDADYVEAIHYGALLPGTRLPLPPGHQPPEEEEILSSSSSSVAIASRTQSARNDNRPLPTNGRTIMMQLASTGNLYMASLAMYAPTTANGGERVPTQAEWVNLLRTGQLANERDFFPTPLDGSYEVPPPYANRCPRSFCYGRVAGVSQGSQWEATLTDLPEVDYLSIPETNQQISYVLSTVHNNTFTTQQVQSAALLARYADTARFAHGNYGVHYNLTLPLYNPTGETRTVGILLQTPLQNEYAQGELRFWDPAPPDPSIFFRGTLALEFEDDFGLSQTRYLHVVQHQGERGEPLIRLRMPPGDFRDVNVQFLYPPDATPPQVLTIHTLQ